MTQHDDHIWLVWLGQSWAIRKIEYPIIYLWRGYYFRDLEYAEVDVSQVNWKNYCDAAAFILENINDKGVK